MRQIWSMFSTPHRDRSRPRQTGRYHPTDPTVQRLQNDKYSPSTLAYELVHPGDETLVWALRNDGF